MIFNILSSEKYIIEIDFDICNNFNDFNNYVLKNIKTQIIVLLNMFIMNI